MGIIERESRVWNAKGVTPASGDEVYSAGQQPVAAYDNWAMWAITADIKDLNDTFGSHDYRHEAGGPDEIDINDLSYNSVAHFHGDGQADELQLIDDSDGSEVAAIDVVNDAVRTWPRFATDVTLGQGATIGGDLVRRDDGSLIYDYSTGKFANANHSDTATEADFATNAGNSDQLDGYHHDDFIKPGDNVTATGDWSFDQTVSADISGHAASADSANSATTADSATNADNADKLDGKHADEIINDAKASGTWTHLTTLSHETVGERFLREFTSNTVYDMYRITTYHEQHGGGGTIRLRIGSNGTPDERHDYIYTQLWDGEYRKVDSDYFAIGGTPYDDTTIYQHIITCPTPENDVPKGYPKIASVFGAEAQGSGKRTKWGALEREHDFIDTLWFKANNDKMTGRITIEGRDI